MALGKAMLGKAVLGKGLGKAALEKAVLRKAAVLGKAAVLMSKRMRMTTISFGWTQNKC